MNGLRTEVCGLKERVKEQQPDMSHTPTTGRH